MFPPVHKKMAGVAHFHLVHLMQCLRNSIGTSAFANASYLMADVEAIFLYKK